MIAMLAAIAALITLGGTDFQRQSPPPPFILYHGYVYFEHGVVEASPGQLTGVRHVVQARYPEAFVHVRGQTDTVGSAEDNVALSRRRALFVADYAISLGVDPARIQIIPCGESVLNRQTADEVAEPLNNFAWLDYNTQPVTKAFNCAVESYAEADARR